jgi:alcohol dehydrogenase class IV
MSGQKRALWDFEDVGDNFRRVDATGVAPVISVPSTAGTGSEVGRSSVITNEAEHRKIIIFHPTMMPRIALCDPEVTRSLPKNLTAWTGIDALSHSLEAICAKGFHPLADGIALEAIRLVHRYLQRAVDDGHDLEARAGMLAASLMGATAFQKGLGAMHALAHPIGGVLNQHHGRINAVVMPYVLAFNRRHVTERLARVAAFLGLKDASFDGFLAWVLDLRQKSGIPHDLRGLTVNESHVDKLAHMAAVDPAGGGNPVALNVDACRLLLRAGLDGRLPDAA